MNGEGILYIIKSEGKYILYSNNSNVIVSRSIYDLNIQIYKEDEWIEYTNSLKDNYTEHNNKDFFKNFLFFSNVFHSYRKIVDDDFIIDTSIAAKVNKLLNSFDNDNRKRSNLMSELKIQQDLNILELVCSDEYHKLSEINLYSLPELIEFKFIENKKIKDLYDKYSDYFPKKSWIGENRYQKLLNIYGQYAFLKNEREFHYEAALNLFCVCLMQSWLETNVINNEIWENFIDNLSKTKDKNGIEILKNLYEQNIIDKLQIKYFHDLLYLIDKNNKFILIWQTRDRFVIKWDTEDKNHVKNILEAFKEEKGISDYYDCTLTVDNGTGKGMYSSGEFYRLRIFSELYLAYKEVMSKTSNNNNLLVLFDEIDVYFHPSLQTTVVHDILKFINIIFHEYNVQIIFTTNNPFALSDIPSTNIIYLNKGEVFNKDVNTFAANINILLKDSFFMDSTIGKFSKQKINQVINFLNGNRDHIEKEEVKYIISMIGEPIVKNKLERMYYEEFADEIIDLKTQMEIYKEKANRLHSYISDGKVMNQNDIDDLIKKLSDVLTHLNKITNQGDEIK